MTPATNTPGSTPSHPVSNTVSNGPLVGEVTGHVPGSTPAAPPAPVEHPHPVTTLRTILRSPVEGLGDREAAQLLAWVEARAKDAETVRQLRETLAAVRPQLETDADLLARPLPRPVVLKAVITDLRGMAQRIGRLLWEAGQ
jgi:hypothetical protein